MWVINLRMYQLIKENFNLSLLGLRLLLVISFNTTNLFLFYLFFESIPTFIIIAGWGYQRERIKAGVYLLFSNFVSPSLACVILFIYRDYIHMLSIFGLLNSSLDFHFIIFIFSCLAFLVKLPIFLVYTWMYKVSTNKEVY